jgi:hypothetical protein
VVAAQLGIPESQVVAEALPAIREPVYVSRMIAPTRCLLRYLLSVAA